MNNDKQFYKLEAEDFKVMPGAETYFCNFKDRKGWAIVFIHEPTGTIALHTDYGNWAFCWPAPSRGKGTLKEFLLSSDYDYLAHKFEQGQRDVFDFRQSKANISDAIAEAADEKPMTWNEDKVAEMRRWLEEDAPNDARDFVEAMPDDLKELLREEPWQYFAYDRRPEFYWLRDGILPAVLEGLKSLVEVKV